MAVPEVAAPPPKGVFVSSPTFFCPAPECSGSLQDKVDIDAQIQHSILLAKLGVRGVVRLGSIGEAIHLIREERIETISGVIAGLSAAGCPGYPMVAGVLTPSVHDTLDSLRDCAQASAYWGLVIVPGYFGKAVTQKNIIEYFTLIADQSHLPILLCPAAMGASYYPGPVAGDPVYQYTGYSLLDVWNTTSWLELDSSLQSNVGI